MTRRLATSLSALGVTLLIVGATGASSAPRPLVTPTWLAPRFLASAEKPTEATIGATPKVATDRNGLTTCVWVSTEGAITASTRRPGRRWSISRALTAPDGIVEKLRIVATDDGSVVIAYLLYGGDGGETVRAISRGPKGRFGDAVTVATLPANVESLDLAAISGGEVWATWGMRDAGRVRVEAALRSPSSTWAAPQTVLSADYHDVPRDSQGPIQFRVPASLRAGPIPPSARHFVAKTVPAPRLATDRSGHVAISWSYYDGTIATINASTLTPQGVWSPPRSVDAQVPPPVYPQVAMASGGELVAVWTGGSQVVRTASLPTAGPWSPVENLSALQGHAFSPAIAVDANDIAIITWSRLYPAVVEVATKPADGTWGSPQALVDTDGDPPATSIAVGPNGSATVLLSLGSGYLAGQSAIQAIRRVSPDHWSVSHGISPPGELAFSPSLAFDGAGNATLVWQQRRDQDLVAVTSLDTSGPEISKVRAPSTARAGAPVTFSAYAFDAQANPTTISWRFPDTDEVLSRSRVTHRFPTHGNQTVMLTATDAVGNRSVKRITVAVTS